MTDTEPTTEQHYRLLVEGTQGYAMLLMDTKGCIILWSTGAERIMGWSEAEVLGQSGEIIFTPEDRAAGMPAQELAKAASEGRAMDLRWHLRKDGSRFFADGMMEALRADDGSLRGFAKILRDATEEGEHRKREVLLGEIAERARSLTDADSVIADAVRSVGEFLGVGRCVFGDIDLEADTCTIVADYCADASIASIVGTFPFSEFGPFVVAEYQEGRAVSVDDVRLDPVRVPPGNVATYEAIGIRAHITAPVVHSSRLVSVIAVHSSVPRHWHPEEVSLLQTVVERTWLTVEVLRQQSAVEREAAERREAHERTARILESITDSFFALDTEWRFTYLNAQAEQLLSRTRADLLGKNVWAEFPAAVGSDFDRQYHHAMQEQTAVAFEAYYPPPLDIWFEVRAYPSPDGLSVYFHDITERAARRQRERFLSSLAERARGHTDPDEVIADAVRSVGEFLGVERCIFGDIDIATDTCLTAVDYCADETVISGKGVFSVSSFGPLVTGDFAAGRAIVVNDVRLDPARFSADYVEMYEAAGMRAHLTVPVVHPDRLVSVLGVQSATPREWTPEDVALVRAVVERTWLTVEVLRQQRALVQEAAARHARAEREALLNRISLALRGLPDPEQVLETSVRELGMALGADRCYYAAYNQDEDTATVGPDWHQEGLASIVGQYAMSRFTVNRDPEYKAGRTQVMANTEGDAATVELGLRALVRVPLVSGTSMTALSVAMVNGPRDWTASEVSLIEAVATQTQSALEAVRVRRREHNIAEQLQAALQPPLPAGVAGLRLAKYYEAALEEAGVGGDFYDVFALEKGCTALVVGDLSGKGLRAAAEVSAVRNMLRAFLYSKPTIAEAVTDLNRVVALNGLLSGFATLFVGCYDGATGELSYVNLGQESPLLRRAATGQIDHLTSTGPVLGADENAFYEERTVSLSSGDSLAIFTDGATECGPSRREMLGIEGVAALLQPAFTSEETQSAERMAEAVTLRVVEGVDAASRGGVAKDDICILVAVVENSFSGLR